MASVSRFDSPELRSVAGVTPLRDEVDERTREKIAYEFSVLCHERWRYGEVSTPLLKTTWSAR